MKTRIISGIIGVALLVLILFLHKTFVYPLCIGAITAIAIFELFRAKDCLKHRISFFAAELYAVLSPFFLFYGKHGIAQMIMMAVIMLMFLDSVVQHEKLKMDQTCFMLVVSVFVTKSLGLLITLKQMHPKYGFLFVILALCSAWVADTGAYFTGTFLGKHRLCPEISPKKTVEGFIGGIVTTVLLFFVFSLIYGGIADAKVQYFGVILIAAVCAVISVLGDLTASILKRQCGIKDFGNIMPGHGGVMDRFDSVLFTLPAFYALNMLLPIYQ